MMFFNLINYALWRVSEKICSKFNIYAFVKTHTGLKNVNIQRLYSDSVNEIYPGKIIIVEPSNLFLSVDYLKDKYTLLDCCILDSPHYAFIEAINSGKDIKKTDYYKRFINGYLDGRHCQRERNVSYFYNKNEKAKQSIESNDYRPVVVYSWKNRYYICDGKHRAALCAFMKKEVRCIVVASVSDFCKTTINKEIYRIMSEDKNFSRHINYFKDGKK